MTTPINGENIFGININYDSDFETVKQEIGKLGNTDYDLIESLGIKILKEKSKDIRIFSFLALVYLRNKQWESLADIFDGLCALCEKDYDSLFPDRARAKQLAFKWLSEDRFKSLLEEHKPEESNYEQITRLRNSLSKIKSILEQKFPDGSPFPSSLFNKSQLWEKSCKPKPVEKPPVTTPEQTSSTQEVSRATVSSGSSSAAVSEAPMETPKQGQTAAKKAAIFLIEKEPHKSMGYRLLRTIRWDILEKTPPSENGKTQLTAPPSQLRTSFQNLINQKDWKTALEKSETSFSGGANHLWLDLQRISHTACRELGDQYKNVADAVLSETAFLINRLPELISMSFSDGSPFCDDLTKDWISTDVKSAFSSDNNSSKAKLISDDPVEAEQREVNGMAASGKIEAALDFIQNKMRTGSERDNFRRKIMIGSLLLKAKQPDVSISVLELLDKKITEYNLDIWEPELATEAWSALFLSYKAGKVQKPQNIIIALQEKQNNILSKISQINPGKAFMLNK
ncbi:MAG TPA: type VI secretion system protein TssA [Chitinispirillaceae bacterium]|nr:type VI secretion system protein TssA [Chitinispirillaceae bacterium]